MSRRCEYGKVFKNLYCFQGFKIDGINLDGLLVISLGRTGLRPRCPVCGKSCRAESVYLRRVRDFDIAGKSCYLEFPEYKVKCRCGHRGMEKLGFVRPYSHCTRRYEEFVALLCDHMSIKEVSEITGLPWRTVKDADMRCIRDWVLQVKREDPVFLGVDEVAYEKGHHYLTIVRDVQRGIVIWAGEGRKETTLDLFFQSLGEAVRKIRAVVMDMWDPYIASTSRWTRADIVFDKFHVAKKVNETLDKIRRREFANAAPSERREFKKKRFIILKRRKNLDETGIEKLSALMDRNKMLYKAYLLKEQLMDILDTISKEEATHRLSLWEKNVRRSKIPEYQELVKTLEYYMFGIHAYFDYGLTNAASEGFNNKINLIKRRAYGFHDIEYFKLKILKLCGRS
ncbi:MAG TPA: ISL3 family transposase [Methanocella sp.]|nr:ISL3 family transposase [Methanocella sp.]